MTLLRAGVRPLRHGRQSMRRQILRLARLLLGSAPPLLAAATLLSPVRAADNDVCYAPELLAGQPGEAAIRKQDPATRPVLPEMALPKAAPLGPALRGSIRRVDLPEGMKLVALTFDLCEASGEVSGYDAAIFDYLRAEKVPATFFAGGKWLMSHPARAAQIIADPLFETGNHTWSHGNLSVHGGAYMQRQVDDADAAFQVRRGDAAAAGCALPGVPQRPVLFRFPYGTCNADSMGYVNETGHLAIQWDVDSGDPAFLGAKFMADAMLRSIRPGSIVLMHANGRGAHTAEAVRRLVPALAAKGYRFVTVSELLAAGRPVIADSCYSLRPGDTKVYDDAARAGRSILKPAR